MRRPLDRAGDSYEIDYSDVTINLLTMEGQRTLDVRFPLATAILDDAPKTENAYWTNHPECVLRTWIEEIRNPPTEGAERWFHIEFDVEKLLAAG
jgi:hypothetical protein